jgi:hypothetical protein
MMHSNAIDQESPFQLVRTGKWKAAPDARYVKLHIYFDEPVPMSAVEVDGCVTPSDPKFSVWLNFEETHFYTNDEADEEREFPYPAKGGLADKTYFARGYPKGTEARSLTFNFESWQGVSLCGLRVYDAEGKPYHLVAPTTVGGTAIASSTLSPEAAYDVMNLFDSRFEYAWASAGEAKGVDLVFRFAAPQTIDRLRIWNGYQRSGTHCIANSRAKRIEVTGDGGYSAALDVKDELGSQVLALPKPFTGRELRLRVTDAWVGKAYEDLVISELRFGSSGAWFMLDSLPMLRAAASANRAAFDAAGVTSALVLNQSYAEEADDAAKLRLRADGSFYLSGRGERNDEVRRYFALGNFEVALSQVAGGLRLRLFGIHYETEAYGDCNGCGRDCNRKSDSKRGKIFEEYVTLKLARDSRSKTYLRVDNESGGKKLPFKELELWPEHEL